MPHIALQHQTDWQTWRIAARRLVLSGIEPSRVTWSVGAEGDEPPDTAGSFSVPRALVSLAALAFQAREAERFALLYALVWRAQAGERVMDDPGDPDVALVRRLALAVRAEAHRMRTLIRFMPVPDTDGTRFLGWFAPAHYILGSNALLMARRFPKQRFSIVTPDGSAHWDGLMLRTGAGLRHAADDATLAAWWNEFGPAVLDGAVDSVSVPEAEDLDESPRPLDRPPIGPVVLPLPTDPALTQTARQAAVCTLCPLYASATQTVFGEGPAGATVMFVGEQPGDQEDTIGRPFVGPAGQMMDRALEEAGIDRRLIYVTNAVKHFKFRPSGKRRIHQTPEVPEITTCNHWLRLERDAVRPKLLVLMGGSAARAVMGRAVTISRERGRVMQLPDGQAAFVTVHPSYLLRLPDAASKSREYAAFVQDLRTVRALISRAE